MIALIMAGGSGTRFWPQSRQNLPKQFLKIAGERSMIQLTVDRLLPIIPLADIYIVTAANQVELVKEHLPALPGENIISEPFGMNTAPCIALSAEYLAPRYPETTAMLILPADHVIRDTAAFHQSLLKAKQAAIESKLITFGIVPDYPATGYGYIEAGKQIADGIREVTRFKEKPDFKTAKSFLESGNFFWNSGMFCWTISTIRAAFAAWLPEVSTLCGWISELWQKSGYDADISELYRQMPRIPIDIGIMEKADARYVIPVDIGWSDVGSWKALADISPSSENGNHSLSPAYFRDASNNYIQTSKYTAVIGINDLCVIETPDALLIVPKDRSEEVKYIIDHLKQDGPQNLL